MLLWAAAGVPLGVYNIVEDFNVALKIQPQMLITLSLITWAQCLYYGKVWLLCPSGVTYYQGTSLMAGWEQRYSVTKCIVTVVPLLFCLGAIETGLIFALKEAKSHNLKWPLILMAVLSACLLAAGVLRHYWDIYIHRTVRGISFFFVGIDAAGDLFSLVSVCECDVSVRKRRATD